MLVRGSSDALCYCIPVVLYADLSGFSKERNGNACGVWQGYTEGISALLQYLQFIFKQKDSVLKEQYSQGTHCSMHVSASLDPFLAFSERKNLCFLGSKIIFHFFLSLVLLLLFSTCLVII